MPDTGDRIAVLIAAAGGPWESTALRALSGGGVIVLKRCVDLADLLATAGSGQADVAVVAPDLPGLDASSVTALLRHDVRTVAIGDQSVRTLTRIGVSEIVPSTSLDQLPDVVRRAATRDLVADPDPEPDLPSADPTLEVGQEVGRVLVVWGPAGAPGRTTVAVGVAAELAARRRHVVLADLDPYGGAVAQHLGMLDEASGLLSAARLANAGELDERRFAASRRLVGDRLEVLTGLPRADRWVEVRDGVVSELLERASRRGHVLVDTGFCLEEAEADLGRRTAGRNRMTLESLGAADEVIVVGSADPVGLTRLARGLVELSQCCPAARLRVAVNRMRDSLGWDEKDIRGMVEGFVRPQSVHFLPEDRAACDRALVAGRAIAEIADSPLRKAIARLVDDLVPAEQGTARRGAPLGMHLRRRRGVPGHAPRGR